MHYFHLRDPRIADWIQRLEHQGAGIEHGSARSLGRAQGTLLDGVAMRGSLPACAEALRLDNVLATSSLVLFKLDAARSARIAPWVLLAMGRLAHQPPAPVKSDRSALLLIDEVGALGSSARHLRGLVGRAREAGPAAAQ